MQYLLSGIWVASVTCVMVCQLRAALTVPACCHSAPQTTCCEHLETQVAPSTLRQAAVAWADQASWWSQAPIPMGPVQPSRLGQFTISSSVSPGDPPGAYVLIDSPPQAPPTL